MGQALYRLGCDEVTVVEALDLLLSRKEPFSGEEVANVRQYRTYRSVVGDAAALTLALAIAHLLAQVGDSRTATHLTLAPLFEVG